MTYPELEKRVAKTYAARSRSTNKNSLYDTYKMAIRWASDRIGEQGVMALVTNGSWIGGNVDSGVRACLAEEFSSIYVLNLRGNQRTQGERSRQEGGKVFGQGSRAPVAVTILVRNPGASHDGCRILYRDIGDYLRREEKLAVLREAGSIAGIEDWRTITPDRHHDWIGQRSEEFQKLYPVGSKAAKAGRTDEAIFKLYSNGYKTGKDAYLYNFSRDACTKNARKMVDDYLGARAGVGRIQEWITHGRDHSRDHGPSFLACSVGSGTQEQPKAQKGDCVPTEERHSDSISTFRKATVLRRIPARKQQVPDGQYFPCVRQRKPRDLRSGWRFG